jgi:UDP-N-acetylglucosamine diphosphorylase/glucosamine-1-phosphate N-acetyltransferase
MQIVLFEDHLWSRFLPLVYTRPVGDLRMGMMTMAQRYSRLFNTEVVYETRLPLRALFAEASAQMQLHVNARLFPTESLMNELKSMQPGDVLKYGDTVLARCIDSKGNQSEHLVESKAELNWIQQITDLFSINAMAMKFDFGLLPKNKSIAVLHPSNIVIGNPELLFVHESAKVYASTFNTLEGPIYIDADAEVMEGTHIRGGFYLGEHATLKLGTKIYGATTIGPQCKVGGEVSNSIFYGHSNKAHDGFVGNSIIGEWCNLGADTNTSNLKNNYSNVSIWSYEKAAFADTGLTFCGLIMGDHSKCGINTMFNTGTIAGVNANIYGGGFPDKHIPSFSWGGPDGWEVYDPDKAFATIAKVMQRRSQSLTEPIRKLLLQIFADTAHHRNSAS